ncbi:sodium:proton antiporter [bacterium]|jgi:NhaP-type Na+/H+ or K+/H+ antiporter|nr:sodium:proton antiporter [bacterium]
MDTPTLLKFSAIPFLGITCQWFAWRFKIPSILLLLITGLIVGPFLGLLNSDTLLGPLLFPIVSLSTAIILFEGGMSLKIADIRNTKVIVKNLITKGILISWILITGSTYILMGYSFKVSILLGSLFVMTGPTVILPLLKYVRVSNKVSNILKWEGTTIDPIIAILTLLIFEVVIATGPEEAVSVLFMVLLKTVILGTSFGCLGSFIFILIIEKHWCPPFLQESITLILVIAAFVGANILQKESGLLAVTVMGIILGNQKSISVKHIVVFKENLSIILLSSLFIILASRLNIQDMIPLLNYKTLIFIAIVIFIARPASIFLSNIKTDLTLNEKIFMSFMAPRGIVCAAISSLFAIELSKAGFEEADQIVSITFILILSTVTFYALLAAPLAKWLKLTKIQKKGILIVGCTDFSIKLATILKENFVPVLIVDTNIEKIKFAESLEIRAMQGDMLSDVVRNKIHEDEFIKLLAMTNSDEINLLVVNEYLEKFGRNHIYRLFPTNLSLINSTENVDRFLFFNGPNLKLIGNQTKFGTNIKSIPVPKNFKFKQFLTEHIKCIPLLVITKRKTALLFIKDKTLIPRPGQTLVYLA